MSARLAPHMLKGDAELRRHFKTGIALMMQKVVDADVGQLLYLLDGYDFARFMRRFNSPRRAENYRAFETYDANDDKAVARRQGAEAHAHRAGRAEDRAARRPLTTLAVAM